MRVRSAYFPEVTRKILHMGSATIPLVYVFLSPAVMRPLLLACAVVMLALDVARFASPAYARFFRRWCGFMVRHVEWERLTGSTYVLVGACVCAWLFPKSLVIPALLVAHIADAAASLIGLRYGRSRFLAKSLAGSSAFFVAALAILWIAFPNYRGAAFAAAWGATVMEALPVPRWGPIELNDNLTVPLLTAAVLALAGVA